MPNKRLNTASFISYINKVNAGMILMVVALIAIVAANSPLNTYYFDFLNYPLSLKIGDWNLLLHHGKPMTIAQFINDCLMVIFFFHVGLEIKRELLVGELSTARKAALPIIAAVGGMIMPVIVFSLFGHDEVSQRGAAIPMATDIAFSLGVLSLLGKRVPIALKIFLTAFAVVDDIGGILVIAFFYTTDIHWIYLISALVLVAGLFIASWLDFQKKWIYIIVGIAVWYLFLQSGVHSTIAGVLVAFTIPAKPKLQIGKYIERIRQSIQKFPVLTEESIVLSKEQINELKSIETASDRVISPLQYFEDKLHGFVNYFILPLFAFANAGIILFGGSGQVIGMVSIAIALGLIIGKPLGVFGAAWLFAKLNVISIPTSCNRKQLFGVSCLGGIGFTVSLFIANLSYGGIDAEILNQAKMGIILGTLISGVFGYCILNVVLPKTEIIHHKKD